MHKERRGIIHAVLDSDTPNPTSASDIEDHNAMSATRKTFRKQMRVLEKLSLGETIEADTGRDIKCFRLDKEFAWPLYLEFPPFE